MSAMRASGEPAMAPPTQAVVFDFGGVLFNWRPAQLIQAVLPQHAGSDAQALALAGTVFQSFVPGSDWAEFDRGVLAWHEVSQRIAARTGLPQADVETLMAAIPPHLKPMQETVAWLEQLAESGMPIYYLSNMPRPYAEYLQAEHGFLQLFKAGVFSSEVRQVKPNADIFETAAHRFGIDPNTTVFIDDAVHNVTTARALGWRAVQFESASQCRAHAIGLGWLT